MSQTLHPEAALTALTALIDSVMDDLGQGLLLDDVLEQVYKAFKPFIPYNRISCAFLDPDTNLLQSRWVKTDYATVLLKPGYKMDIATGSLLPLLASKEPRVLNDLLAYYREHPQSGSTAVAIAEGIRASLTCPLISSGITIGFLFVSSNIPGIYTEEHQRVVSRLARRLTLFIERGRLLSTLAEQKRTIDLQRAELQQAVLNNTKVLGSVAHDLRNQLGNIVVMSQLLKDDRDPIRNQMFLGEINQTATSALQSVDDLIDAAQISAGKFKLNRESIALMPILTAAISRNAPLAAQRKSHMDIATIGLVVNIFVDPLKLRQVFDNLLNNALRYSPSGTRVSIGIAHEFGVYKLYISDNGPGIPAGELSHLFKPFSRLPTPPLGSPGIGLGLYLVKSVIEAHGGTVGVDSIVGKGSVFWFTLPDTN